MINARNVPLAFALSIAMGSSTGAQERDADARTNAGNRNAPLSDYEGGYAYHGGSSLTIVASDTGLFAVIDEAKYPLRSIGGDRFMNRSGDTIPFPRAATGAVSGFVERGVFFPRRTTVVDPATAALVRDLPRPLGKDGRLPYAGYDNPDPRKDALTLRDLLTMQTGLACNDWDDKSPGNESIVYQSKDWVKFVLDLPMIAKPGTQGSYCSGGVSVAGRIVELATAKSLPAFAQETLFGPLGIRAEDYRWDYTLSSSNALTFSQLYIRPRDMLKLGILFHEQGSWKGRQVISRDWVARSTAEWSTLGDQTYGYFWWHQWTMAASPSGQRRVDMVVATGNGGQKIYIVPALDLIVVLTGGNYNAQSPSMSILAEDLLPALLR